MGTSQKFGGPWTVEKLNILSGYLNVYTTALKNQPFQLIYIDAFAGTGKINIGSEGEYSVTVYSHLQACGIINDHWEGCFRYQELICCVDSVRKRERVRDMCGVLFVKQSR